MMKRFSLALVALAALPSVAAAQARPPAQKTGPITIYGSGSTGDVSSMSAAPQGGVPTLLSLLLRNIPKIDGSGNISFLNGPSIGTFADGVLTLAPNRMDVIAGRTSPPNADGAEVTVQNTATTGYQIYSPQVPPGWKYRAGIRASVVALPGTTDINTSGFDYYVLNQQSASTDGFGRNAVGLFGVTACAADNTACWGINPALIDHTANGVITSGVGKKLIGAEFDFSVTSPNTIVQGVSLNGSSQINPAGADGYSCGSLGGPALWTHCFVVPDGVAQSGLYLGAAAGPTTGIRPSLPVQYAYYNADNTGHLLNTFATQDFFAIQRGAGGTGIAFGTSPNSLNPAWIGPLSDSANVDLELRPNGTGQVVARGGITSTGAIGATKGVFPGASTRASLPSAASVAAGTMMYCFNCLKPTQQPGAGTGMMLFSDGGTWYSTAGTVAAN